MHERSLDLWKELRRLEHAVAGSEFLLWPLQCPDRIQIGPGSCRAGIHAATVRYLLRSLMSLLRLLLAVLDCCRALVLVVMPFLLPPVLRLLHGLLARGLGFCRACTCTSRLSRSSHVTVLCA